MKEHDREPYLNLGKRLNENEGKKSFLSMPYATNMQGFRLQSAKREEETMGAENKQFVSRSSAFQSHEPSLKGYSKFQRWEALNVKSLRLVALKAKVKLGNTTMEVSL